MTTKSMNDECLVEVERDPVTSGPVAQGTVADVMTEHVISVGPHETLRAALDCMIERHCAILPVIEDDHCLGVLSASDILGLEYDFHETLIEKEQQGGPSWYWLTHKIAQAGLGSLPVRDVMTSPPISVSPSATIEHAAVVLLENEVHRAVVIEHKRVVGIVSATDLLRAFAHRPRVD